MIIAVVGKGGVGKTTVCSLILRRMLLSGQKPLLCIDADPSSCLGPALCIDVQTTLADMRDSLREDSSKPLSMSQAEWFALKAEEAMVEQKGFDLLTMGHPEGKGCYCFVNNLIRDHLDRLAHSYRHVLLDCEAGLEHLSRRTAGRPDVLVCVTGRSRRAPETVRRSLSLFKNLHEAIPHRVDLMLNGFEKGEPLAQEFTALAQLEGVSFNQILHIPTDPQVGVFEETKRSLLLLPPESPAVVALDNWECVR